MFLPILLRQLSQFVRSHHGLASRAKIIKGGDTRRSTTGTLSVSEVDAF